MPADLHLHTIASDGSWSLGELIDKAKALGLTTIAITDHDTVDAFRSQKAWHQGNLEVITGVEFSTEFHNHEIHILGYYIDINNPSLLAVLQQLQAERELRAQAMVERLNELGCQITYNRVQELAGPGTIGRVHIAQALIEAGYTQSIKESFSRFLEINGPAYVPRRKISIPDAIELITAARGIPVLAHPGLVGDDQLIAEVINMGLMGLEVIHSSHNMVQITKYYQMARQFGLVPTGGSDCHGPKAKDELLIGKYVISDTWVCELKQLLSES
ncbi:MAG TPA: PHP domain-containing protein [Firmicutes bacterium]|nr:PHP domain-containing protein [Bacillota bacterium]